jgi:hypothetical protein
MSERQKVWARWVALFKKLSIGASFGLLAWSGYALVSFKPDKFDVTKQKAPPAARNGSLGAASPNAQSPEQGNAVSTPTAAKAD